MHLSQIGFVVAAVLPARLGEHTVSAFLLGAALDLDRAFEVRTVFDHNPRRGQIAGYGAVFLNLKPVLRAKIAVHVADHQYLAGNNIRCHLRRGPVQLGNSCSRTRCFLPENRVFMRRKLLIPNNRTWDFCTC